MTNFGFDSDPFADMPALSSPKKKVSSKKKSSSGSDDTNTTRSTSSTEDKSSRRNKVSPENNFGDFHNTSFNEAAFDNIQSQPRARTRRRASLAAAPVGVSSRSVDSHMVEERRPRAGASNAACARSVDGDDRAGNRARNPRSGRRVQVVGSSSLDGSNGAFGNDPFEESGGFASFDKCNDYGYENHSPSTAVMEYGYDNHQVEPQPNRRRAQRRSSVGVLLDDFKTGGGGASNFPSAPSAKRDMNGPPAVQQNIMLPMTEQEKPQRRVRRSSMLGAIGGAAGAVGGAIGLVGDKTGGSKLDDDDLKHHKRAVLKDRKGEKKSSSRPNPEGSSAMKSFDRERRRTGALAAGGVGLERSGASSRSIDGPSYSDRIMMKR